MKLRRELVLVLLLLVIAAPARLLGLDVLPPGLFHDEAYEGIDAVRILNGARPVFLPENYGREPLYAYAMAGLIALGGPTVVAVRATSALFGLLAIPAAWFWGRSFFGPSAGLLMAALTSASYWVLHESRVGMRPISLPLFLALASGFGWLAARRGRAWAWPLGGLFLGLSLYTYLPARLFPLVVAGQVVLGLLARSAERRLLRPGLVGPVVLVAVAVAVAMPLALYLVANPEDAGARADVVSIFASEDGQGRPLLALGQNLVLNLGMFVWRGDETARHNLPYRPVFDLLIAPFFLLGVVLSIRAIFRRVGPSEGRDRSVGRAEHAALWLWLGVMLLPGLLSDSAPHFLRSIGLLPALFALPALGLLAAASWLQGWLAGRGVGRAAALPAVGLVGVLAASQALTWWDYFDRLPREPALAELFDARRAALARLAGDPPPGLDLALPTPGWSYATIRFLRPRSFAPPDPRHPTEARFDRHALLLGFDLDPEPARPSGGGRLTLYWRALRELNASYVRSVRVLDEYGRVWWEAQGEPSFGTLPTDTWAAGETIADRLEVALNPDTPAGTYQLEVALAQPNGGRRLPVFDAAGKQIGSAVKLSEFRVER